MDGETTAVQRTLTGPFYPSRNVITTGTGNGFGITTYIFEGPVGGLRFANGATTVFGRPRVASTAAAGAPITNTNAPYLWSVANSIYEENFDSTIVDINSVGEANQIEERVNIIIRTTEVQERISCSQVTLLVAQCSTVWTGTSKAIG